MNILVRWAHVVVYDLDISGQSTCVLLTRLPIFLPQVSAWNCKSIMLYEFDQRDQCDMSMKLRIRKANLVTYWWKFKPKKGVYTEVRIVAQLKSLCQFSLKCSFLVLQFKE